MPMLVELVGQACDQRTHAFLRATVLRTMYKNKCKSRKLTLCE